MNQLLELDHWFFHKINQDWTNSVLDRAMPVITDLHHSGWIWILVLLNIVWLYYHRTRAAKALIASVLAFGVADSVSYRIIKPIINRPRPEYVTGMNVILRVPNHSGQSFPSNHATNSFAVANVVGTYFPAARWWAFAYAALVAYSRVYVGVHFPTDVLGGALLGLMLSYLILWLMNYAEKKIRRNWSSRSDVNSARAQK